MSRQPLSNIAQVNPPVRLPVGLTPSDAVSFIPMTDVSVTGQWITRQSRALGSTANGFTTFEEGDVLVAKITPCLENGKGAHAVGLQNGIGFGSTEFHVLRARTGYEPRFIFHVTQWRAFRQAAASQMVGSAGQQRVQRGFFDEFLIAKFDAVEQAEITRILDSLDIAIQQTEAIIAKLKALKQGLLHDVLTRGVDANGELRPPQSEAPHLYRHSAIGWTPKEWGLKVFGDLCASSAFGPRFPSNAYDEHGPLATLRTTDMDDEGNISLATMPRAAISPMTFADHLLRVGDIVISRSGTCGVTGVFGGHDLPVVPGAFLIRFRLRDLRLNRFYRRYFNSSLGRPQLDRLAVGGVQKNIKGSDVLALRVPVAAPEEAISIAELIESAEAGIVLNESMSAKLLFQKSGLMDDLLTGRVRFKQLSNAEQISFKAVA